jgi:hypothetical protein
MPRGLLRFLACFFKMKNATLPVKYVFFMF